MSCNLQDMIRANENFNIIREKTDRVLVQPDGVQRGLIGSIITRFEQKGYKLVALKMASPTKSPLECASPFSPSGSAEGRAPGWMLTARRAQEALR